VADSYLCRRKAVQLPDRFRCDQCQKWKHHACFSKKQLNAFTYKKASGQSVNGISARLRCVSLYPKLLFSLAELVFHPLCSALLIHSRSFALVVRIWSLNARGLAQLFNLSTPSRSKLAAMEVATGASRALLGRKLLSRALPQ
jgi:hypothetical protein